MFCIGFYPHPLDGHVYLMGASEVEKELHGQGAGYRVSALGPSFGLLEGYGHVGLINDES